MLQFRFTNWLPVLAQYPVDWPKVVKEGDEAFRNFKDSYFAEAKRRAWASVAGISSADEYYQLMKGSIDKESNVGDE